MGTRKVGLSEARRRLPELVRGVARDGGRVDITYRGRLQASLLRVSDGGVRHGAELDAELRIELAEPHDDLVSRVRALRAAQGHARTGVLFATGTQPKPEQLPKPRRARAGRR